MEYALAEMLGKTHKEIQKISVQEFQTWRAYLQIKEDKNSG